ncbi:Fungalysin metallopeptidase-domain-containing protein [Cladochytrium replicatum]|nr:Fungalysin metallopeptidase-domain-containing protein [Cladochytrium replicatum]
MPIHSIAAWAALCAFIAAAAAKNAHQHANAGPAPFGPSLSTTFRSYIHDDDSQNLVASSKIHYSSADPSQVALEHVAAHIGLPLFEASSLSDSKTPAKSSLVVRNSYSSRHNGVSHVYLNQYVHGLPVINAVANVNVKSKKDFPEVLSFGSSMVTLVRPERSSRFTHQSVSGSDSGFQPPANFDNTQFATEPPSPVFGSGSLYPGAELSPADALAAFAEFLNPSIQSPLNPARLRIFPATSYRPGSSPTSLVERRTSFNVTNVPTSLSVRGWVPVSLKWVQIQSDEEAPRKLRLVWDVEVEMEDHWYHAQIDAKTGDVRQMVDWVADAAYRVYPFGTNDPHQGPRELVVDPADPDASPLGWHSQSATKNFSVTIGNNVYAHENLEGRSRWEDNYRPNGGDDLVFDFAINLKKQPSSYLDAAVTNLFYWNNVIHDLFYRYGFDEESGNFQENNFGRGGIEGDAVIANAQDGSGTNNANFATPPDGMRGRMRMYVWDNTDPYRDGDLEAGIIIHEYAHGISTRLTGGPANSGCLGWGESGGMGEGWGDVFATVIRMSANNTRKDEFGMGEYSNGGDGIRKYKYSTSKRTNPSTYSYITKPGYWGVHAKGEVWAEILYEVYWDMVDEYGFSTNLYANGRTYKTPKISSSLTAQPTRTFLERLRHSFSTILGSFMSRHEPPSHIETSVPLAGNVRFLQLVVDGLKFQPCDPSFVDARDAILQADEVNFDGAHSCLLWKAFARRGLGKGARSGGRESVLVPAKCKRRPGDDEE